MSSFVSRALSLGTLLVFLTACTSLTMNEEAKWGELINDDIVDEPMPHKNVWAAGILDLLIPGFGHFYLGLWGSGGGLFLSNIFWPFSPFWATPAAVLDTKTVNKRYTVEYYSFGPGRAVIEAKEEKEMFQHAASYVRHQQMNGKGEVTQREVVNYLFMQDYPRDQVMGIDWIQLEMRTGARFKGFPAATAVGAPAAEAGASGEGAPLGPANDQNEAPEHDVGAAPAASPDEIEPHGSAHAGGGAIPSPETDPEQQASAP